MSIDYCHTHGMKFDTDFMEACPECLNSEHQSKAVAQRAGVAASMLTVIPTNTTSDMAALIRILRDETNSASVYARCVAIVGERQS